MSGAFVSESGVGVYDEIASYLQKKLDHEVSFITGFSYSTINSMFDSGMADIGFMCGLPYVMKADEPQPSIELFLAPVMKSKKYKNKPIYYSYVIVHKDSKFENFSDLKGSTFSFNDEISNSGYNMPRAKLIAMGETSGFFAKIIRSGSHEESIRMVALGKADVSAVDSLVYDYDAVKNPEYVQNTKILEVLGPAGIPPIVISTRISRTLRQKISDILLGMKSDPLGAKILEQALVDRFIVVEDSNYNSIRKMSQQAQDSGYQVIR
jgi:phosphonate transport system substrate-binding protein